MSGLGAPPRIAPRRRGWRRKVLKAWLIPDRSLSIDRLPWADVMAVAKEDILDTASE